MIWPLRRFIEPRFTAQEMQNGADALAAYVNRDLNLKPRRLAQLKDDLRRTAAGWAGKPNNRHTLSNLRNALQYNVAQYR